jgi:hypothetical protein
MTSLKSLILSLFLSTSLAELDFNYRNHGNDWPEDFPDCGLPTNQSPINLEDGGFEDDDRATRTSLSNRKSEKLWAVD